MEVAVGAGVAVGPGVLVGGGTGVTVGRAVGITVGTVVGATVSDGADFVAVGCSVSSFLDDEQDPTTAIKNMAVIARTAGRIGLFN